VSSLHLVSGDCSVWHAVPWLYAAPQRRPAAAQANRAARADSRSVPPDAVPRGRRGAEPRDVQDKAHGGRGLRDAVGRGEARQVRDEEREHRGRSRAARLSHEQHGSSTTRTKTNSRPATRGGGGNSTTESGSRQRTPHIIDETTNNKAKAKEISRHDARQQKQKQNEQQNQRTAGCWAGLG